MEFWSYLSHPLHSPSSSVWFLITVLRQYLLTCTLEVHKSFSLLWKTKSNINSYKVVKLLSVQYCSRVTLLQGWSQFRHYCGFVNFFSTALWKADFFLIWQIFSFLFIFLEMTLTCIWTFRKHNRLILQMRPLNALRF